MQWVMTAYGIKNMLKFIRKLNWKNKHGKYYGLYLCDCGQEKIILINHVNSGNTKSCRCLTKMNSFKHGYRLDYNKKCSREYQTWICMKTRCYNKNRDDYKYYGGRGIKVCDRWKNNFMDFLKDMGERPKGTTIDRIDVNGGYEPNNCRWATPKEQVHNRRPKYEKRN